MVEINREGSFKIRKQSLFLDFFEEIIVGFESKSKLPATILLSGSVYSFPF